MAASNLLEAKVFDWFSTVTSLFPPSTIQNNFHSNQERNS